MMKNINKLALLLKLNMLRSIAASLSWRSPVIALKQALELHWTPFEWATKSLLWSDILSDAWKATWVTAAETYSAVIPSNLHVLVNSAVAIHNTRLAQFVFVKEPASFYEPQFSRNSLNISLSDYILETKKKIQEKVLNWTCQTNSVCKLLQYVNFDGYWTLMVWHFWQDSSYSTNQIIEPFLQGSWYTYWSVLYESIEHADDTDNHFGSKVCFENWK